MAPARATAAKSTRVKSEADRRKNVQRGAVLMKHISDPTRLLLVLMLSEGEQPVGALGEALSQSQPAISHHLALLRHGGVVSPRRQGKNNFYALTDLGERLAEVGQGMMAI